MAESHRHDFILHTSRDTATLKTPMEVKSLNGYLLHELRHGAHHINILFFVAFQKFAE